MNRRDFLRGLLATTAIAVIPASILERAIDECSLSGVIEGKTFYVRSTLHIYDCGVMIRNCNFIAMPELRGDMLHIHKGVGGLVITDCSFDMGRQLNLMGEDDRYVIRYVADQTVLVA